MSNRLMNLCRPVQMAPTAKNVWMAIADRADDNGFAWPSIPGLCEATCYSRTAVIDALKSLESGGWLKVEKAKGRNNRFTIVTEPVRRADGSPDETSAADGRVSDTDQSGRRTTTRPADAPPPVRLPYKPVRLPDLNHQEPSSNHHLEPPKGKSAQARKTTLPDGFGISDEVRSWAQAKGYADLEAHLEAFVDKCRAKGYTNIDWNATFKGAIRDDWAKVRLVPQGGARTGAAGRQSATDRQIATMNALTGKDRKHRAVSDFTDVDYTERA